jgi:hypothetical protein
MTAQLYACDNKLVQNAKNVSLLFLLLIGFQIIYYNPNIILNIILGYKIDREHYHLFLIQILPRYYFKYFLFQVGIITVIYIIYYTK